MKKSAAQRRRELKAKALDYLGGNCRICGYNSCMEALDFHHTDPTAKEFTISSRMSSWKMIQRELDKVVLLCCRCHRELHFAGMHQQYLDLDIHTEAYYQDEDLI